MGRREKLEWSALNSSRLKYWRNSQWMVKIKFTDVRASIPFASNQNKR